MAQNQLPENSFRLLNREQLKHFKISSWEILRRTPPLVFAMAVLGIGLVTASGELVRGIRNANDTITVTGSSTERITSDYVDWSVEVANSRPTQQSPYQGLQPAVQKTIAFLKAQGIASDEMELGSVKSEKEEIRDPRTGELRSTNWLTKQSILIGSWNVDRIYKISGRVGQLIGQGVPLTINEPAYTFTKLAEKRVDSLLRPPKMPVHGPRPLPGRRVLALAQLPTPTQEPSKSQLPTPQKPAIQGPTTPAQSIKTSLP